MAKFLMISEYQDPASRPSYVDNIGIAWFPSSIPRMIMEESGTRLTLVQLVPMALSMVFDYKRGTIFTEFKNSVRSCYQW